MDKARLQEELNFHHYAMIRPSPVHGIGVFAVRPIPKGCRSMFSKEPGEWVRLSFEEVAALPEASRYMIETYCLFDEQDYFVPAGGFKTMDIALYLNHSDEPNIQSIDEGAEFEALRDIQPGEELFIDYGTIVNSEE
ncbi:MAG TPA: SET domain-containing protein [Saprospiraceae bacterium]|nr:SET domain-containing protein [Saprospiraceae bacterium]HNT18891.1 SET domain-containing protein [Saprospiraceae bacterium]